MNSKLLQKIYFLKNAKKTCKRNNRNLNLNEISLLNIQNFSVIFQQIKLFRGGAMIYNAKELRKTHDWGQGARKIFKFKRLLTVGKRNVFQIFLELFCKNFTIKCQFARQKSKQLEIMSHEVVFKSFENSLFQLNFKVILKPTENTFSRITF